MIREKPTMSLREIHDQLALCHQRDCENEADRQHAMDQLKLYIPEPVCKPRKPLMKVAK